MSHKTFSSITPAQVAHNGTITFCRTRFLHHITFLYHENDINLVLLINNFWTCSRTAIDGVSNVHFQAQFISCNILTVIPTLFSHFVLHLCTHCMAVVCISATSTFTLVILWLGYNTRHKIYVLFFIFVQLSTYLLSCKTQLCPRKFFVTKLLYSHSMGTGKERVQCVQTFTDPIRSKILF